MTEYFIKGFFMKRSKLIIGLVVFIYMVMLSLIACSGKSNVSAQSNSSSGSATNSTDSKKAEQALQNAINSNNSDDIIAAFKNATPELFASNFPNLYKTSDPIRLSQILQNANRAQISALSIHTRPASDFRYDLNSTGDGIIIREYTGRDDPILMVFPAEIEGYPVVEIYGVFNSNRHEWDSNRLWNYVVIPEGVKTIYKFRVYGSISLPSTLTKIGSIYSSGCFEYSNFTSIDLSICTSLEEIEELAFRGCNNLVSVKLPDNIVSIKEGAFMDCKKLMDINIPTSIKKMGETSVTAFGGGGVFWGCGELINLYIPENVSSIKFTRSSVGTDTNFQGCGKLPIATRQRLQNLGYKGTF